MVAGLLLAGQLGEEVLEPLRPEELEVARLLPQGVVRGKSSWQPPLFPLLPRAAYAVAERILALWGNPYLAYARDPEELRLSLPLYQRRPDLPPPVLRRVHYTALLARELLREGKALAAPQELLRVRLETHVAQASDTQE